MPSENGAHHPPICDYEGSDYQKVFWDAGERAYEDRVEAIALQHLLPVGGELLLEIGAGAGRNTPRYKGFQRVVLLDYSRTQLRQAQARLGDTKRYIYVAADAYRLPFVSGLFDAATMIRTLHHMADAPLALGQVRRVLQPEATFILEYANKRNLKAILRYLLRRQDWNPFDRQPVEYIELNFNFHPAQVRAWLQQNGFEVRRQRTVSHFRLAFLKQQVPLKLLAGLDALLQPTGALLQFTPSVFVEARAGGGTPIAETGTFFRCPLCEQPLSETGNGYLTCPEDRHRWALRDGIYDFKEPLKN